MIVFRHWTHIVISTLLGLLLVETLKIPLNISLSDYIIGIVVSSLLPDADQKSSPMGKIFPLWKFIKHRTITHSIFFFLLPIVLINLFPAYFFLWLGLFIGISCHIFADLFTPSGCRLLYPAFKTKFCIGQIRNGSLAEKILMITLTIITAVRFCEYFYIATNCFINR
ncbi:MAG: metal-dependent hydrolase [Bacillota bacterium]